MKIAAWKRVPFAVRFALALLTPVFVIGLSVVLAVSMTALPDDAALRVGDKIISRRTVDDRVQLLAALYGIKPPADSAPGSPYYRQTAASIATSTVLEQAAAEQGIVISDEAARAALRQDIDGTYGGSGQQAFVDLLKRVGASEQDVVNEVKLQNATAALMQRVSAGLPKASEADARAEFDRHPSDFEISEQRHLANIVLETEDQAKQIMKEAGAGADFGTLAEMNTLDPRSRDTRGDLGTVAARQLEASYAQAAFAAPVGGLFGPVQTRSGWNVGRVIATVPARARSFDEVKDQVREGLDAARLREAWNAWLSARMHSASIEYAPEYRPEGPDVSAPAAVGPGLPPGPADEAAKGGR